MQLSDTNVRECWILAAVAALVVLLGLLLENYWIAGGFAVIAASAVVNAWRLGKSERVHPR